MMKEYSLIPKVKAPACCSNRCCGNHFGRINSHKPAHKVNRKKLSRRYLRHAMKNKLRQEIESIVWC